MLQRWWYKKCINKWVWFKVFISNEWWRYKWSYEKPINTEKHVDSQHWLQRTNDGKLYTTVRIHLIVGKKRSSEQGGKRTHIKVLQRWRFKLKLLKQKVRKYREQYKDSYVDYRFGYLIENFLLWYKCMLNNE